MAAILCNIQTGDEIIVPSYTFVSTALAFVRQGAKIVFADSHENNSNIDADKIEQLITDKTKAIITVHYAGIACDMKTIMELSNKYKLLIIEDAAHSINSYYISQITGLKKALGSIGHFASFSFHESKNIISSKREMVCINDGKFIDRAEVIWEKNTNKTDFFRGNVDKYGWIDVGSSFLPSEILAAFLYAQFENLFEFRKKRMTIWQEYYNLLCPLSEMGFFSVPSIPDYSTNNAHIFFLICNSSKDRDQRMNFFKKKGI